MDIKIILRLKKDPCNLSYKRDLSLILTFTLDEAKRSAGSEDKNSQIHHPLVTVPAILIKMRLKKVWLENNLKG